jgi:hypothetical protein
MLFGEAVKAIRSATSSGVVMRPVVAPMVPSSWCRSRRMPPAPASPDVPTA